MYPRDNRGGQPTCNPLMYYVIGHRLAQGPDTWQPFELGPLRRPFFGHDSALPVWYRETKGIVT